MIIGITGHCEDPKGVRRVAGAGKDAAADFLVKSHSFVRVALADPLKRICQDAFEFSDEQLWGPSAARNAPDLRFPRPSEPSFLTPRYALQQLGTEWGRECYYNVWIEYGLRVARRLEEGGCYYDQKTGLRPWISVDDSLVKAKTDVVFTDIRFFNEYNAIRAAGGKVVRVSRQVPEAFNDGLNSSHQSEVELVSWEDEKFDYVLQNSGTLHQLELLVHRMMDIFTGKIRAYDEAQEDVPPYRRP